MLIITTGITLAFLANSDFASKWLGTSGKVKIEAVGKGDKAIDGRIPNSCNLEIDIDRDYGVLIPNMPITLYANCKVYKSTTKPLLRASVIVTVVESTGNPVDEDSIDDSITADFSAQIYTRIEETNAWYYHSDGYFYLVNSKDGANSLLTECDATSRDYVVPFLNGVSITVPKDIDDSYSGLGIKISITFQAIQNYIPDDNGLQLPNTITNSLKIFNEFKSTIYESSPISWFDSEVDANGNVSLTAKEGVDYPEYLRLPQKDSTGRIITNISSDFAQGNASIKNIYIPSNYTTIDDYAFQKSGLLTVDMSESNITEIPPYAFYNSKLQSIILPPTLKAIRKYAFFCCSQLSTLNIPEGCTTCEYYTIGESNNFRYLSLPSTLTNIVYNTFSYMPYLFTINVASGNPVLSVVDNVLLVSSTGYLMACVKTVSTIKSITIPDNITKVYGNVFNGANYLENIVLGESLTTIDFSFPSNLKTLSLGSNTNFSELSDSYGNSYIASKDQKTVYAINLADSATTLTIPNSIVTFSYNCLPVSKRSQITHINIGSNMSGWTSNNILYYYSGLETVSVDSSNTNVKTLTGNELISYDGKTFYNYCSCCKNTEYTIPDGINAVFSGAFRNNYYLKKLTIPSSVTTLPSTFAYGCTKLEEIVIPSSITYMGSYSFWNCKSISTLTTYGYFKEECLNKCVNLKNITINNCSSIDTYFMNDCTSLEWVEFTDTTPPTFASQLMFENTNSSFIIYVPDSVVDTYKTTTNLSVFADRIKPVSERG